MTAAPDIARRSPDRVMRLKRLGSLHQSRLSFMRILMRRMAGEAWTFQRPVFDIDATGVGRAVYSAVGPDRTYSLVAFAHNLPADQRSDRVIAEAWDATFALFDGVPTAADLDRLAANVPLQEAGRVSERELTLSRANRSVRLWEHVVSALAQGQQPDTAKIDDVGYLMRTTAVYGSGKFGAADREQIADRPEMHVPFQVEMLTVYLIRTFVRDLVQHMADAKGGPQTAQLDPAIACRLGIGNSTGLGMAPYIVNHPILFNNWIIVREEAIARVRAVETVEQDEISLFQTLFSRAEESVARWKSAHEAQIAKLADLRADIAALKAKLATHDFGAPYPWDRLMTWAEGVLSEEGEEFLASLMLEPYAALVDGLTECMADDNVDAFRIDGAMALSDLKRLITRNFGWALDLNWAAQDNCARAWYVSEEKLEPRLGERFEEPIAAFEQPLAPARDAAAAFRDLATWDGEETVAAFLVQHPEHRHTARRAQMSRFAPYGEIRDNTISADVLPIDMLRAKLSFFGATHFDPRSDRWVRICMFAGAPYPEMLNPGNADHWVYPAAVS